MLKISATVGPTAFKPRSIDSTHEITPGTKKEQNQRSTPGGSWRDLESFCEHWKACQAFFRGLTRTPTFHWTSVLRGRNPIYRRRHPIYRTLNTLRTLGKGFNFTVKIYYTNWDLNPGPYGLHCIC